MSIECFIVVTTIDTASFDFILYVMIRTQKKKVDLREYKIIKVLELVMLNKSIDILTDPICLMYGYSAACILEYFIGKTLTFKSESRWCEFDRVKTSECFEMSLAGFNKNFKKLCELKILEYRRIGTPIQVEVRVDYAMVYEVLCHIAHTVKSKENIDEKVSLYLPSKNRVIYIYNIMDTLLKDYIIFNNVSIGEVKVDKKLTTSAKTAEKNKKYLPYAKRLFRIIRKQLNVQHSRTKILSWCNPIRKLVESDKISIDRVEKVLTWYRSNIGGKYIPVAYGGIAFRGKFSRLEAAMERGIVKGKEEKEKTARPRPMQLIRKMRKGLPQVELDRIVRVFKEARKLISNCDQNKLSINVCNLHKWIISARHKAEFRTERSSDIGTPGSLLMEFIWWLDHQDWISNISENVFKSDSKLFKRFLTEYGEELGVNLLTGK